jgi:hypothetical protein
MTCDDLNYILADAPTIELKRQYYRTVIYRIGYSPAVALLGPKNVEILPADRPQFELLSNSSVVLDSSSVVFFSPIR